MSIRGRINTNMRRPARDSRGGLPARDIALSPPLPASAVEYWHSGIQCAPAAWIGQIGGRSLTGVNTPVVAADSAHFNGRVVAQTSIAGTRYWRNGALAPVLIAGSQPWVYLIGRYVPPIPAVTAVLAGMGAAGTENGAIRLTAGTGQRDCYFNGVVVNNGTEDFLPHRFKMWKDGVNAHFDVDGTDAVTATATNLTHNITAIAVGSAANSAANFGDGRTAFYLLCSSKPSAAEEAALDAWAFTVWGVPIQQTPPLPASVIEYWHSELGVTLSAGVDSWAGQVGGRTLAFSGARPAYGADGANFRGRSVVQTSDLASLRVTGLPVYSPSGSRPWVFSLIRAPSAPAVDGSYPVLTFGIAGVADFWAVTWNRSGGGVTNRWNLIVPGAANMTANVADTTPHRMEQWLDGAALNMLVDSTLTQQATAGTTTGGVTAIGFGCSSNNAGNKWHWAHAFHMICASKPSVAEIAAMRSWSLGYFGL